MDDVRNFDQSDENEAANEAEEMRQAEEAAMAEQAAESVPAPAPPVPAQPAPEPVRDDTTEFPRPGDEQDAASEESPVADEQLRPPHEAEQNNQSE